MFSEWVDDFTARINQIQGAVPKEVNDYIKLRATEEFVKITGGAKGNQTAEEIAKGMYGQAPGAAEAASGSNPALFNAQGVSQLLGGSVAGVPTWALLAVIAVGGYYLMKRR